MAEPGEGEGEEVRAKPPPQLLTEPEIPAEQRRARHRKRETHRDRELHTTKIGGGATYTWVWNPHTHAVGRRQKLSKRSGLCIFLCLASLRTALRLSHHPCLLT